MISKGTGAMGLGSINRSEVRFGTPELVAVLGVTALGAALRLYRIGWHPLWLDEGWSEWVSRQTLWYIWARWAGFDAHPPLYYTLLRGWQLLLGNSEAALRALSASFGVATIPLVYAMGRLLRPGRAGVTSGFVAATLFALSPLHVQYAQEARPYAMLTLAVALALFSALWLMHSRQRACAPRDILGTLPGGRWLPSVLGLLGLSLAWTVWSHYTGGAAAAAILLSLAYWWMTEADRCPTAGRRLLLAIALAAALCLPLLWILLSNLKGLTAGFTWLKAPRIWDITFTWVRLFGAPSSEGFLAFVLFWTVAVLGLAGLWHRGQRSMSVLLIALAIAPPAAEIAVSLLAKPVFLERTLLYVNLPLFLGAGYAVSQIDARLARAVVAVTLLATAVIGTRAYFREFGKEPWHRIVDDVAGHLRAGEPLFLFPAALAMPLEYYAIRRDASFRRVGVPADYPDPSRLQPSHDALPVKKSVKEGLDRVAEIARANERVALVLRNTDLYDPEGTVLAEIMKTHTVEDSRSYRGVDLILFTRNEGAAVAPAQGR